MMPKNNTPTSNIPTDSLWSILLALIYLIVFCCIMSLGYLMLEEQIHAYLNQKSYSPEELKQLDKKAMVNQRLESEEANWDRISKGIHIRTGLQDDPNLQTIISACTSCHSAKLITQNKATREGWKSMITWMQATQGLADLGKSEPVILDYLAKYYAPKEVGRRKNIDMKTIEWYVLNVSE